MQYSSYKQIPWYRKNWFAVLSIFIFPPALLPVLLTGETYYQRKGEILHYSKIAKGFLLVWGVLGFVQMGAALVNIFGDSEDIQLVKNGQLGLCPGYTVEQLVDGYMASPAWDSGTSSTGEHFVNIDGDVTYQGKQVRASMQFIVSGNMFTFTAIELNGVPSANVLAASLLDKMCQDAVANANIPQKDATEHISTSLTSSDIAGNWANETTTMTIEPEGDDFNVVINVVTETGCTGDISGGAKWTGKHYILKADESSCVVEITPKNGTITLAENECSSFHGMSCSFDGELARK